MACHRNTRRACPGDPVLNCHCSSGGSLFRTGRPEMPKNPHQRQTTREDQLECHARLASAPHANAPKKPQRQFRRIPQYRPRTKDSPPMKEGQTALVTEAPRDLTFGYGVPRSTIEKESRIKKVVRRLFRGSKEGQQRQPSVHEKPQQAASRLSASPPPVSKMPTPQHRFVSWGNTARFVIFKPDTPGSYEKTKCMTELAVLQEYLTFCRQTVTRQSRM